MNPEYQSGLSYAPFRSCLLHNKAAAKTPEFLWQIRSKPKYFTYLSKTPYDVNTGEIMPESTYITDDLTSGNNRKIKAVNRFVDTYKGAYKRKRISMLFGTLTLANEVDMTIKDFMCAIKKRIRRNGHKFYGYLWVLEISPASAKNDYKEHVHYHYLLATSRINCKGESLPDFLMAEHLWGARTGIEFVSKGIKRYLSKYFVKNKVRITGKRLFGKAIDKDSKELEIFNVIQGAPEGLSTFH